MQWAFILVICIIAISVIVIAMVRTRLKNKSKELAEKLNHISAYSEKSNYEQARERLSALNEGAFIDIPSDLNNGFYGRVISATQEKDFINHYKVHFQEAYSLLKKLEAFNITPSETISKFINDFGRINKLVKQHNDGDPLAELNKRIFKSANRFVVNVVYILKDCKCTYFPEYSGKQSYCIFSIISHYHELIA